MALGIVLVLRLGLPLLILRFPLAGAVIAFTADLVDMWIFEALNWSGLDAGLYQPFDKVLDSYYLLLELMVALRWKKMLLRDFAIGLYTWRMAGVLVFVTTGMESILFLAPNIFEYFYLVVAGTTKFRPAFRLNRLGAAAALVLLLSIPKYMNEYILHIRRISTIEFVRESLSPIFVTAAMTFERK